MKKRSLTRHLDWSSQFRNGLGYSQEEMTAAHHYFERATHSHADIIAVNSSDTRVRARNLYLQQAQCAYLEIAYAHIALDCLIDRFPEMMHLTEGMLQISEKLNRKMLDVEPFCEKESELMISETQSLVYWVSILRGLCINYLASEYLHQPRELIPGSEEYFETMLKIQRFLKWFDGFSRRHAHLFEVCEKEIHQAMAQHKVDNARGAKYSKKNLRT